MAIGIQPSCGTPGPSPTCRRGPSATRPAGAIRPPSTTTLGTLTPTRSRAIGCHRRPISGRSGRSASMAAGISCRGTACTWRTSNRSSPPPSSAWADRPIGRCRTGTTATRPTPTHASFRPRSAPSPCRTGSPIHSASPHATRQQRQRCGDRDRRQCRLFAGSVVRRARHRW